MNRPDLSPFWGRLASGGCALSATLLLLLVLPAASWGQRSAAAINGTVRDPSGAVIPQATITLTNTETNVARTGVTDSAGEYIITAIPPGTYVLRVQKQGFESVTQPAFTLQVNQTTTFNFTLHVGTTKQVVTVQAVGAQLQTSTAGLGSVVTQSAVNDLPLNGRNFTEMLDLTPGVSPISVSQNSNGGYSTEIGEFTFPSVNGQTNRSNLFLTDGIIDQNSFTSTYSAAPEIDDIEEFKVQSHNDEAQFGGALGGIINVVTKGGTNALHGDAYDFVRNQAFDARGFFLPPTEPIQAYAQNQFGATVGGPIIIPHIFNGRNKTFFYASFTGFRDHEAEAALGRVPTAAELNGDLSDFKNPNGSLIQIYNPFSTTPDPNHPGYSSVTPFLNNQIPANLISPQMVAYASLLPKPINTGVAAYNALDTEPDDTDQDQASLRFDEVISPKDSFFVRYTGYTEPITASGGFVGYLAPQYDHGYNAVAHYTHTFSGTALMDLEFGRNSDEYNTPNAYTSVPANFEQQTGFSPSFYGDYIGGATQVPAMEITDYLDGGSAASNFHTSDVYEFKGDFTKLFKRHTFTMGADFASNNAGALFENANEGFSSVNTSCTDCFSATQGVPVGGVAFASFLLGVPNSAERRNVQESEHGGWVDGFYFQDQWKVTNKLTANLGLRYDLTLMPIYGNNQEDTDTTGDVDFNDGTYIIQKMPPACNPPSVEAPCIPGGTLPAHVVVTPHSNGAIFSNYTDNWAPRVGLAYALRPTLVLHGSFGRFYDSWAADVQTGQNTEGTWPQIGQLISSNLNLNQSPTVTTLNPFPSSSAAGIPAPTPFASSGFVTWYMNPLQNNPYSDQWTLGIEKQLGPTTTLTANYVGSSDHRLDVGGYYNVATTPGPGNAATVTSRQPYPYIPPTYYDRDTGSSNYNALQVSLNRTTSKGLTYILSYTYSKAMSYACDGWYGVEGCSTENPYDLKEDYSVAGFDITNAFSFASVYHLPVGEGARWRTGNRPLDYVLGNWQINGIWYMSSGQPFFVNASSGDIENTGNVDERADQLAGVSPYANEGGASPSGGLFWLNSAAFVNPAPYTFGTEGRYDLRMDWPRNLDFSLFREFPITESKSLQFRVEAFNLFNTPRFGQPDSTVGDEYFGQVFSQANSAREIQLVLKLYF
jgi:hypothetical protein